MRLKAKSLTHQGQDYHEVQLVLRVPRAPQPPPLQPPPAQPDQAAAQQPSQAAGDSALGVDGIELREQSHEEALLSTIGAHHSPLWPDSALLRRTSLRRSRRQALGVHCCMQEVRPARAHCNSNTILASGPWGPLGAAG